MQDRGTYRVVIKSKLFGSVQKQLINDIERALKSSCDIGGGFGSKSALEWRNIDVKTIFNEYKNIKRYIDMASKSGEVSVISEEFLVKSGFRELSANIEHASAIYNCAQDLSKKVSDGLKYKLSNDEIIKKNVKHFDKLMGLIKDHPAESAMAEAVCSDIGRQYIKDMKKKLGMR